MALKDLFAQIFGRGAQPAPGQQASAEEWIGGDYKVLRAFEGGMGRVLVVKHIRQESPIVLKTTKNLANIKQFFAEAEAWVRLGGHPNIVRAYGVETLDGIPYVLAEYVAGAGDGPSSLRGRVGSVSEADAFRWTAQFASAMHHMVERGLRAHRDIKPDNLLVDANGYLRVTDFGLVAVGDAEPHDGLAREPGQSMMWRLPQGRIVAGTPLYMAPEQSLGEYTVVSDFYAYGVSLWELLGGQHPYSSCRTREELQLAHAREPLPPLGSLLDPIISRLAAKDPSARFQDPEDLIAHLRAVGRPQGWGAKLVRADVENLADELFAKSKALAELGNIQGAIQACLENIRLRDDHTGWNQLGILYCEAGNPQEAERALLQAISRERGNTHSWNNLGLVRGRLGRHEEALLAFREAVKVDPRNAGALLNAGFRLLELHRYDEALAAFDQGLGIAPNKAGLWLGKAQAHEACGQPQEALACCQKALSIHPGDPNGTALLQRLRSQVGRGGAADASARRNQAFRFLGPGPIGPIFGRPLPELRSWYGQKPDQVTCYAYAEALFRDGRVDEAVSVLTGAVQRPFAAGSSANWALLGLIFIQSNDPGRATACLLDGRARLLRDAAEVVRRHEPSASDRDVESEAFTILVSNGGFFSLLNNLGCLLASQRRTREALEVFGQAKRACSRDERGLEIVGANINTAKSL